MRVKAKLPVSVESIDKEFWTEDISEGGVKIVGESMPLKEGETVVLRIKPNGKEIVLKGKVKHVNPSENTAGIEFERPYKGLLITYLSVKNQVSNLMAWGNVVEKKSVERIKQAAAGTAKTASAFYNFAKALITLIVIFGFLVSGYQKLSKSYRVKTLIKQMEKQRGTKVITLIHTTETVGIFGIPVKRYIQQKDADTILQIIRSIPDDKPIDLIIHTPGGVLLSAYQIAHALKNHKGKVTVFIPHYAMSGGTLISLAADEIVMGDNAMLGPVDPQFVYDQKTYPAVSILKLSQYKPINQLKDETLILYDQAQKAEKQVEHIVKYLLAGKRGVKTDEVIKRLVTGITTHDYPLFYKDAKQLGLPVKHGLPEIVNRIMQVYLTK